MKTSEKLIAEAMQKVGKEGLSPLKKQKEQIQPWICRRYAVRPWIYLSLLRNQQRKNAGLKLDNHLHPDLRQKISTMKDILHILEKVAQGGPPVADYI